MIADAASISDLAIFIMGLNNRLTELVSKAEQKTQAMQGVDLKINNMVDRISSLENKLDKIEKILEALIDSKHKPDTFKHNKEKQKSIDLIGPKDDGPFAQVVTEILKRIVKETDASETYHCLCNIAENILDNLELDTRLTRTNNMVRGIVQVFENQSDSKQQRMINLLEKEFHLKHNVSIASKDSWFAKRVMQRSLLDKRRRQLSRESAAADRIGHCLPKININKESPVAAKKAKLDSNNLPFIPIYEIPSDSNMSDSALTDLKLKDSFTTPKNTVKNVRGLGKCTGRGASNSTGRGKKNKLITQPSKKIFSRTLPPNFKH